MKQKNRFSSLLEHLMEVAELKNYTLANELQYDVSYISKWVSGRMLPSAKTDKAVLQGISHCLVSQGSEEGLFRLMNDYQVTNKTDLGSAIYDNLMAEYNYVRDTQSDTGNTIAPDTLFFPKLNMPQFISKMHHPVLRRVNSLDIMAVMDLISMEREFRLQIASIDPRVLMDQRRYPDVHFSMFIDLHSKPLDYLYDITFLLSMLSNMTHIDFQLYGGKQAYGKAIFAVKDEFVISGMLTDSNQCLAVTVSEDPENSNTMYRYVQSLCTRERMMVLPATMRDMLINHSYARAILSTSHKVRIGHLTEHFLPRELFEDIVKQLSKTCKSVISIEELSWLHALTRSALKKSPMQIIFNESAFAEFAVSGELDFYNLSIRLTPEQRLQCISHLRDIIQNQDNLTFKLVYGRLISDFQYNANQCIFLSDGTSHMRLRSSGQDSLYIINSADLKDAFFHFFEAVWNYPSDSVISDREQILAYIDHIILQIRMIAELDQ